MILDLIFDVYFTTINFFINLFPVADATVVGFLHTNVSFFFGLLGKADFIIDINLLLWILSTVIITEIMLIVLKWVFNIVFFVNAILFGVRAFKGIVSLFG
jgi:hypothetical protein